ncbi:MCE family protein [Nocardia panacis]|uniref:MCE family protein n=1 Tax=Nocardia panacis TaxID=2340916 RepID=A0A3A4K277_9NOCA|nr:MCE family protein [Nocardia panacis]RJO78694.1 MCE family protein [Nocardia panacis]
MAESKDLNGFGLKLAGGALVLAIAAVVAVALTMFAGGFTPTATVTVDTPRSGLVLDPAAKVRIRGVEIGRVTAIEHTAAGARLKLALDPDQLKLVPANATVDIRSSTVFGAKYVNFTVPEHPSTTALAPGATVRAQQVTIEFNTLFERLNDVLTKAQPDKLNAILEAVGTAVEGRGEKLGTLLTTGEDYLRELNPKLDALVRDLKAARTTTNLYADTAPDLLRTTDNLAVTGATLTTQQRGLDLLLANLTGVTDTVGSVLRESEQPLGAALDLLRPTTALLREYAPGLHCMIVAMGEALPRADEVFGGKQEGVGMYASFTYGAQPYEYPKDLPKVNATGGPHCENLSDHQPGQLSDFLVTDTSAGHVWTPSTTLQVNGPKVFQVIFGGLPGVGQP